MDMDGEQLKAHGDIDVDTIKDANERVYSTKLFGTVGYWQRLTHNYGFKFVMLMTSTYLGVKGIALAFLNLILLPFFQTTIGVSGRQYQVFVQVITTPWAIKAWMGTVSDLYPLLGTHKKSYMLISTSVGVVALVLAAVLPWSIGTASWAAVLLFFVMVQVALQDLLVEGKYTELMHKLPHTKGDAVTYVWSCITLAGLIVAPIVGPFSDNYNPQYLFYLMIPFCAQILYPLLKKGYLEEEYIPKGERKIQWQKFQDKKRLFMLAFLMALGAMIMGVINLTSSDTVIVGYAVLISLFLTGFGFYSLPPILAKCTCYLFLQEVLYISTDGAVDYWYTADDECVPDGPHFSYSFYITTAKVIGSIASLVGLVVFQRFMSNWSFRACFWVPTVLRMVASLFDNLIVTRSNIAIGWSDPFAYLFGDAFLLSLIEMMNFMPAVILTSKICPRGYESTTFALLAGFQNFGANVSRSIGVFMMGAFGIDTVTCNFDNLSWLVFTAHFALPALAIPLTFFLIPKAKLSDDIEALLYPGGRGNLHSISSVDSVKEGIELESGGKAVDSSSGDESTDRSENNKDDGDVIDRSKPSTVVVRSSTPRSSTAGTPRATSSVSATAATVLTSMGMTAIPSADSPHHR